MAGWRGRGTGRSAACARALAILWASQGFAQTGTSPPSGSSSPAASDPKSRELADRRAELRSLEETIDAAEGQRRKLELEMEAIRTDRAHLNASLIETTGKIRDSETHIEAAQKRLDGLRGSEQAIRVSLDNRRAIIGEVLASLQRMGRRSPPALLVRPEDVLSAIRTSMLLGAVLPEMRAETEALTADLGELVKLRTAISSERDTLSREIAGMREERQRLSMLVETRQQALSAAEHDADAQREKTRDLSRKAANVRDLIASVESQSTHGRRRGKGRNHAQTNR